VGKQMRDIAEVRLLRADVAMQRNGRHCRPLAAKDRSWSQTSESESAMQWAE
jgi:hypothetical protein